MQPEREGSIGAEGGLLSIRIHARDGIVDERFAINIRRFIQRGATRVCFRR